MWNGPIEDDIASRVRFYTLEGNIILSFEEVEKASQAHQQAEQERQLRQALIEKLQQRSINLDKL